MKLILGTLYSAYYLCILNQTPEKIKPKKLNIRKFNAGDLPFCTHLVHQAGWNQIEGDWRRMMDLDPDGCYIAEVNRHEVGTIVFTRFGKLAWISMVLVDKQWRGQGIGQWMFGQVMARLGSLDIDTIRLDATTLGVGLYRKYGFREEYELGRLVKVEVEAEDEDEDEVDQKEDVARPGPVLTREDEKRKAGMEDLNVLNDLDYRFTGADRRNLLHHMIQERTAELYLHFNPNGEISGFIGWRRGRKGWQIGPCLANDASSGISLLNAAMTLFSNSKVIIDIPLVNEAAISWARKHHFTEERRFIRMYAGKKPVDQPEKMFASFGPEKG